MDDTWTKSSISRANGECVEVRERKNGTIEVRNSRRPFGSKLRFTPIEWDAFIGGVNLGEFTRER